MRKRLVRAHLCVTGTVQGVGFRPFVFRLATSLHLGGFVRNTGGTVEIELWGESETIDVFVRRLHSQAPPVASISSVEIEVEDVDVISPVGFCIADSEMSPGRPVEVPPDIATCDECIKELFCAHDRRFRYPFLNCTNCGPRFTVILGLPYDRSQTSMACFPLCLDCNNEYREPSNRRFHAQPNACPQCGPSLSFGSRTMVVDFSKSNNDTAISSAIDGLSSGLIVAVKGLGGFHLVCDATNGSAVRLLRERKKRAAKPFALMMSDSKMVARHCIVSKEERQLLESPGRPIVLLKKRQRHSVIGDEFETVCSNEIAPQTDLLGVMLPYTPLQHLLLADFGKPLVMTSANLSEEPIVSGNREAIDRLGTIADAFLFHNRDITSRYDDTVTKFSNGSQTVIRRARGYAPKPITLPFRAKAPILAVGGHLKNTFCLVKDDRAYMSQHLGDLDNLENLEHFVETLTCYQNLFQISPSLIAYDLHPDYGSTRLVNDWLSRRQVAPFDISKIEQVIAIQHHFAHIVGCMVENNLPESCIGVAFDGIGLGADRKLWGGEFLLCKYASFERLACLKNVRMPGGVQSIREPWRMALSYLRNCANGSPDIVEKTLKRLASLFGEKNVSIVYSSLAASTSSAETSSCGRLFDGVSSLLGLCDIAHYEGHAAVALQCEAERYHDSEPAPAYAISTSTVMMDSQPTIEVDTTSIIEGILLDLGDNRSIAYIAARFHETIASLISTVCCAIRADRKINDVCLSGGVFQNDLLLCRATQLLELERFRVHHNRLIPANDGGLSLGQAVAALASIGKLESLPTVSAVN